MRDTDIAYIAGIIDGEGSFSIRHVTTNKGKSVSWFKYQLSVTMVSKAALEKCQSCTLMGSLNPIKRASKQGRQIWCWSVCGKQLAELCHLLLPYLIEKSEQAEIIIELSSTMNKYGDNTRPSAETVAYRLALKDRLQHLTL